MLAERRDDLVKFVAAEMDAYKFAATHRDETVKVAHEMTNAKPDDKRAEFISDQAIRDKQIDPTLAIPADRIEWMQQLFVKAGVIPKAVPTATLIDTSVRADAAKAGGEIAVSSEGLFIAHPRESGTQWRIFRRRTCGSGFPLSRE